MARAARIIETEADVLDIGQGNYRMTDEEAIEKIKEIYGVEAKDLASMDITNRNLYIKKVYGIGVSIRQIA